jgi:hypothetical protein
LKKFLSGMILVLAAAVPASAVTYTVKTDGSGDYTGIQACADAAQAGDVCEVYDGTYDESVSPPADGAAGSWITFRAAPGSSPVMTGGWDIEGRHYIVIEGFTCGGISSSTFSGAAVGNIKIVGNRIQNTGIGVNLKGDDVLVSGNTFDNMANDMVRQFGYRWTIRNNVVMGETDSNDEHMDFWQSWCNPAGMAAAYYLIENNVFIDVSGGNVHFALINGTDSCDDPTTKSIIRYNRVCNIGSMGSYIDANSASAGSRDNVIYNNTWVSLSEGNHASWQTYAHAYSASADSSGINNIFIDAMHHSGATGFNWKSGGAQSHNLYYDPDNSMTFSGLASSETGAVKNLDPLVNDPFNNDFSLNAGSPAIDAGGPLTRVAAADTGSGVFLIVEAAEFFQPGWGGADADWIAVVDAANTVQISSIDYGTDTLTLSAPITRSAGDPVYLYRDSDGTQVLFGTAPDIGAFEAVTDTTPPAAPTGLLVE